MIEKTRQKVRETHSHLDITFDKEMEARHPQVVAQARAIFVKYKKAQATRAKPTKLESK